MIYCAHALNLIQQVPLMSTNKSVTQYYLVQSLRMQRAKDTDAGQQPWVEA